MTIDSYFLNRVDALLSEELPSEVMERAAVILIHNIAMYHKGISQPWGRSIAKAESGNTTVKFAEDHLEYFATTIAGTVSEDFYESLHLGSIIIPHVLATQSVNVIEILRSIVAGYEGSLRVYQFVKKPLSTYGIRGTPLFGAIGAVFAIRTLSHLEDSQFNALLEHILTTIRFSTLPLIQGNDIWVYQSGCAAKMVGEFGQGYTVFNRDSVPLASFLQSLGVIFDPLELYDSEYLVLQVGVKRHPVNIYVQPSLEALVPVVEQVKLDSIQSITVKVPPAFLESSKLISRQGPLENPLQAALSIPVSVAFSFIRPNFSYEDLIEANSEEVVTFSKKIMVTADEKLQGYSCEVEAVTESGGIISNRINHKQFYPNLREELEWISSIGLLHEIQRYPLVDSIIELFK